MRLSLQLHPATPCDAITGIEVELGRLGPRRILLRFFLSGNLRAVRFRPVDWVSPQRRDELWRHTCFEAFVRAGDDTGYYEFNLTTPGDWAAYRFTDYRAGMQVASEVGPPGPGPEIAEPAPIFAATLELDRLADLRLDLDWQIGLSAVIEERNGRLSYWALAHPPGPPDFHHPDCFVLELPAARRP